MTNFLQINRALISVSDKTNVLELAKTLQSQNIEIISTGGTAKLLRDHAIPVKEASEITGFPELLEGRVKTLHPNIFAGILANRLRDFKTLEEFSIQPIDLVVANLYPFSQVIQQSNPKLDEVIENIDIGGVSLIRAAAKNYQHVLVVTEPGDYKKIASLLLQNNIDEKLRLQFAQKAFAYTAYYDNLIANYFTSLSSNSGTNTHLPLTIQLTLEKQKNLRYGENPQQQAALYTDPKEPKLGIAFAKQLQGKELSFNNILDADTAFSCVQTFLEPACVLVKHANPCGVAIGDNIFQAYEQAYRTDPISAFGGIIAFNQIVDEITASKILANQFVEVIIAPNFTKKALTILANKPNIRVLHSNLNIIKHKNLDFRRIESGFLVQDFDNANIMLDKIVIPTQVKPTEQQLQDALFAWKVVKFVKSNAIVYAKNLATVGIGAGQMSRIDSAKIAATKALDQNLSLISCVMASDAFFPFRDSVDQAAKIGVSVIIQPGGSIRDEEIIKAADENKLAMILTGIRHFRH